MWYSTSTSAIDFADLLCKEEPEEALRRFLAEMEQHARIPGRSNNGKGDEKSWGQTKRLQSKSRRREVVNHDAPISYKDVNQACTNFQRKCQVADCWLLKDESSRQPHLLHIDPQRSLILPDKERMARENLDKLLLRVLSDKVRKRHFANLIAVGTEGNECAVFIGGESTYKSLSGCYTISANSVLEEVGKRYFRPSVRYFIVVEREVAQVKPELAQALGRWPTDIVWIENDEGIDPLTVL